ncbi:MAG: hypothetical protein M3R55_12175, partial [Acidobacteriota bacterium]|nr:hypothetical protein [Acidobacteriota bacterium]
MDNGRHAAMDCDTHVIDDPDGWRPQRGDDEEEVEMRIMLDGLWHRELDPDLTVCEISFPPVGQYRT